MDYSPQWSRHRRDSGVDTDRLRPDVLVHAKPFNSVGTRQLQANAVVSSKVTNHSLLAVDFKTGQLGVRGCEIVTGRSDVRNQIFNSIAISCPAGKRTVGGGGGTLAASPPVTDRTSSSVSRSTAAAAG
jgi:hypothetical protein